MIRKSLATLALAALAGGIAGAQTAPPAQQAPPPATQPASPPAVTQPAPAAPLPMNRPASLTPEPGAPFPGANSFTAAQALQRILDVGFADVGPLAKDDQGIWRGKAKIDGAAVDVAVDYRGNVVRTN